RRLGVGMGLESGLRPANRGRPIVPPVDERRQRTAPRLRRKRDRGSPESPGRANDGRNLWASAPQPRQGRFHVRDRGTFGYSFPASLASPNTRCQQKQDDTRSESPYGLVRRSTPGA